MTVAKNVGMCHRGAKRGAEALDSARRRADFRQSNVQASARLVNFTVITCAVLFVCALLLLFLCVFFPRYTVGEPGIGPAPVFILFFIFIFRQLTLRGAPLCVYLPLSLFDLIAPPFPPPSFIFRCVAHSLSLSLSSYLVRLALLIWLPFLPYAYYMWLSLVYFAFVSWLSLLNPFLRR